MERENTDETSHFNCILLDGTEQMEPVAHKMVLVDGEKITAIVEDTAPCEGYEKVDLKGGYLMPGLINLHVHLAGNGKPSAKPRDNAALVRRILSNGLTRAVAYRLVCSYAKLELLGGVTTIRTVGGLADFDTRCRDDAANGEDPGSPHPCRQRGHFGARRAHGRLGGGGGPQQCRSAGPAPQGR